jgi:hypothetical protein
MRAINPEVRVTVEPFRATRSRIIFLERIEAEYLCLIFFSSGSRIDMMAHFPEESSFSK